MLEHYGIDYTPVVEEYILWQIVMGKAELRHKKLGGSEQYIVVLECGTKVVVAYDPATGDICTALKPGSYKNKRIHNKKKRNPKRFKRTNWEL
jgi:hypothetical protein